MSLLPLGSVVRLKDGDAKLLVIARVPLYKNDSDVVGFFDYSACIYPVGAVDGKTYYFNDDNIAEVYFEGYRDESEESFQAQYENKIAAVSYPKFDIADL